MKVAVLAESSADARAIRRLCSRVLNREISPPDGGDFEATSWPGISKVVAAALVRSWDTPTTNGLVIQVDGNGSPIHRIKDCPGDPCRICKFRRLIQVSLQKVKTRPRNTRLEIVVGVAYPAIESWLNVDRQPDSSEQRLAELDGSHMVAIKRRLKVEMYGTESPTLEEMSRGMMARVEGIDLRRIEMRHPIGFGELRSGLNGWTMFDP